MNKANTRNVEVYAHWEGLTEPTMVGTLQATFVRGENFPSNMIVHGYTQSSEAHNLDPSLRLYHGKQYAQQH